MTTEHQVIEGGAVIYNPTAGRGSAAGRIEQAKVMLGPDFEWKPTLRAGHATELAREAARKYNVVVALGGDGTVGDVARGIYGTEATLGVIPGGTGNDFARNLNLKLDLKEAISTIHGGIITSIDIGLINGTPFINNAGTGFDARVMQVMNTSIRFAKGKTAFLLAIMKTLPSFKPLTLTLQRDEDPATTEKAMMVSILNGRMYGGGLLAAPTADMDDGYLDVMVIKSMPKLRLLSLVGSIQNGQHVGHPAVSMYKVKHLKMTTTPTCPLNIDGDVTGLTPAEVVVKPRAMKVLVR